MHTSFGFNLFVALRYLFTRRSHHTINLVTRVSIAGVAVGTMAIIVVLSVLNGFESMIEESFSAFDPELKIVPAQGRALDLQAEPLRSALRSSQLTANCAVIDQEGLIAYADAQMPVLVRGAENNYSNLSRLDSMVWNGTIALERSYANHPYALMGLGLASKINAGVDYEKTVSLYAPRRGAVNLARPDVNFSELPFYVSALFYVQQSKYDDNMLILPIEAVRTIYDLDSTYANSVELRVSRIGAASNNAEIQSVKNELQTLLGNDYKVLDRREQQADFFRISNIEKWTTFFILAFILMIATFNIIGSLSMIIIEKEQDVSLFLSLGATPEGVRRLFFTEGCLIGGVGCVAGLILGVCVVIVQARFGLISYSTGYSNQVYPVVLRGVDILITIAMVCALVLGSALYTTRAGMKNIAYSTNEE